eukprot:COSAG02_NODE_1134_length_14376_cov_382.343700_9_plen_413_part_00
MPPLPSAADLPALQLRMVQAEIAALQHELGVQEQSSASTQEAAAAAEVPVGDLSAELSRRLAGLESPPQAQQQPRQAQQGLRTRLKSYADGEYGRALGAAAAPAAAAAPVAAAPQQRGLRARLKSYAEGEYGRALTTAPPPAVTFAADVNPAPTASGVGSSLGRLRSYGAHEYSAVLSETEPEPEVRQNTIRATAPTFVPAQQPGGLSKMQEVALRRQQLQQPQQQPQPQPQPQPQQQKKQENTRMQQMVAQLHQQQKPQQASSVGFEAPATAAAVAQANAANRLAPLKSYSPREYAGVLKPRGSDKTPVKHSAKKKVRCSPVIARACVICVCVLLGNVRFFPSFVLICGDLQAVRTLTPHGIHDMVEVRTIPANDRSRRGSIGEEQQAVENDLVSVRAELESLRSSLRVNQ